MNQIKVEMGNGEEMTISCPKNITSLDLEVFFPTENQESLILINGIKYTGKVAKKPCDPFRTFTNSGKGKKKKWP